jgi:monoamine oxidase
MDNQNDADVIIVGAGAAGVHAASLLKIKGLKSIILEASDSIGGRLRSLEVKPEVCIELGGQWLAKNGQTRFNKLLEDFEYKKLTNYNKGRTIFVKGSKRLRIMASENPISLFATLDLLRFSTYLRWVLFTIPSVRPWERSDLDQISLKVWLNSFFWNEEAKKIALNVFEQGLCCDISQVSALEALINLKSIGNLELLHDADHFYFREGLQNLFQRISTRDKLVIKHGEEVVGVTQDGVRVEVTTKSKKYYSSAVLVTTPTHLLRNIKFDPDLPNPFDGLIRSIVHGEVAKVIAVYSSPWWRSKGLSGTVSSSEGAFDLIIDSSPDESNFVLVGLVTGTRVRNLPMSEKDKVLEIFESHLKTQFRLQEIPSPDSFHLHDWNSHQYAKGGYSSRRSIGQWVSAKNCLQLPHGRVYLAGTETALEWRGYIEGALESAERQAAEIEKAFLKAK